MKPLLRYACVLLCLCGNAYADTAAEMPALKIIATDPDAQNATLANRERFYIEVELPNAGSVSVEPYDQGAPIADGIATSAAAKLPAGGRSVISFFYWGTQPAQVDEIKFTVTQNAGIPMTYALPVHLTFSAQDSAQNATARADWVTMWEQKQMLPAPIAQSPDKTFVTLVGTMIAVALLLVFFIARKLRKFFS